MRYLVTGATGFLGQHLIRRLPGEVREFSRPDRAVYAMEGVDVAIHLAAQTEVGRAVLNPVETFEGNVRGTWTFLDACRKAGVKRIIVASSDKAYGRRDRAYDEGMLVWADRPYEVSKVCADLIARTYEATYDMNVAVTRCGNLYGPGHMNWSALIPGTIRSVLRNERPVIRSDGSLKRDYLFIEDAVEGYLLLARNRVRGPVNLGTGVATSVRDVVGTILKSMGSALEPDVRNEPMASHEIPEQRLDCLLAKKVMGWEAKYDLKLGLDETTSWYRSILL